MRFSIIILASRRIISEIMYCPLVIMYPWKGSQKQCLWTCQCLHRYLQQMLLFHTTAIVPSCLKISHYWLSSKAAHHSHLKWWQTHLPCAVWWVSLLCECVMRLLLNNTGMGSCNFIKNVPSGRNKTSPVHPVGTHFLIMTNGQYISPHITYFFLCQLSSKISSTFTVMYFDTHR